MSVPYGFLRQESRKPTGDFLHRTKPSRPAWQLNNRQLVAARAKDKQAPRSQRGREELLRGEYDVFILNDHRDSQDVRRKEWWRDQMPDQTVLRLMARAWIAPESELHRLGFVAFFRTDRDTLGLIFEDARGLRSLWTIDVHSNLPRFLGETA